MPELSLSSVAHAAWGARHKIAESLILLFLLHILASTVAQYYRLRHIKGPFLAGVSKWWLLRAILRSQSHLETTAVTEQYGPIARIGPNDVVVCDPDIVKQIHAVGSKYTRSSWYESTRLDPFKDHVLAIRDESQHSAHRSKLAAGYSGRDVQGLETQIDDIISKLISLLNDRANSGERFDLARKVAYFAIDTISQVAFGKAFGFLDADSDLNNYVQTTETFLPFLAVTTVFDFLTSIRRSRLFAAILPMEKVSLSHYEVLQISKKTAAERFGPEKGVKQDMIGSFMAHGLSQEQLEGELPLTLLAGGETTAHAIRTTILHTISNHVVFAKLRAEIDSAAATSHTAIIPESTVRRLPYLQAVFKEGLRVLPPVTGFFAKEPPPEGAMLMGTFIPGGTRININFWGLSRHEKVWGKDADEFRPERWFEADGEKLKQMNAAVDMLFSSGRYQCLGKALAQRVILKTVFEVIRQFDLTLSYPMHPMNSFNYLVFVQKDLWVRANRRAEI